MEKGAAKKTLPAAASGSRQTAIGAAKAIPEAEIEAVIAFVELMMAAVVAGSYEPSAQPGTNEAIRKHLPAHMVCDAHYRHHQEDHSERSNMDGDNEDQCWNHHRAGHCLKRVKAHRRPGRRRAARMMHRVGGAEQRRAMHHAVHPVEPAIVRGEADQ